MKSYKQLFVLKTVCTFALLVSLIACNNEKTNTADNSTESKSNEAPVKQLVFDKLVGTWQSGDGTSFEQWTKNANGTYQSRAFSVKGSDTSWNEQATIYPENDKWIFENTVKGQNGGRSIKFTSSSLNENSVQFSNPAHNFPTDVNYTVADAYTVNAFIVGPNSKGGKDTIPFGYKRIK